MADIDRRASLGLCCFQFLHYERRKQIWGQKLDCSYCTAPTCENDDMLCTEHYRAVSGVSRRDAMGRIKIEREQRRAYRRVYYMKRRREERI